MIRFERNTELNIAIKNLICSMVDMNDYITTILNYTEKILTPQKEKELIKILKKYNIPHEDLKYDSKVLTENPYFENIKLDSVDSDTVNYEISTIKKRTLIEYEFP